MRPTAKKFMTSLSALAIGAFCLGSAPAAKADSAAPLCSLATLKGHFGVKSNGTVTAPGNPARPLELIAVLSLDGAGNFNASPVYGDINGDTTKIPSSFTGTYVVNSDCTGALDLTKAFLGFTSVSAPFVSVSRTRQLLLVVEAPAATNPAVVDISGSAERRWPDFD